MSKRRSNGEGSLYKRPNGLWTCTIMVGNHDDGRRKYKSFYGKTQKEVKEKVAKNKRDIEDGLQLNSNLTFSDWADEWYKNYEGQVSACTYESYRYTINLLKEGFGNKKLTSIKTSHVESYLKKMVKEGRSPSSIAKLRGMLFQIMKKAAANDLIRKNPVRFAEKMRKDGPAKPKDSFTAGEIHRLMKNLPFDRIGLSIRVMLGTGLRSQELLALEPQHIEPDGSVVHVRQAVKLDKGVPYVGKPKSRDSYRDIPVPMEIRPYLIGLRACQDQTFLWESPRVPGRPVNPSSFRKDFKAALQKVGEVRLLTPHACRHTYVSQLQASGVDMETIQSLVGHADTDMTEKYLHVQPEIKQRAIEKLGSLFRIA